MAPALTPALALTLTLTPTPNLADLANPNANPSHCFSNKPNPSIFFNLGVNYQIYFFTISFITYYDCGDFSKTRRRVEIIEIGRCLPNGFLCQVAF